MSTHNNSNRSTNKMNELTFMMCEKITHLTKVVYLLNAKQDDSEAMIESIINSYEKELWTMVKDSNGAMSVLKDKIKTLTQDNLIHDHLKIIENKYNQSLKSFSIAYDQLKKEILEKEIVLDKDVKKKIDQMKNEIIVLKKETEVKVQNCLLKECKRYQMLEKQLKEIQKDNIDLLNDNNKKQKIIKDLNQELAFLDEKTQTEINKLAIEREKIITLKAKTIKEQSDEISVLKSYIETNENKTLNIINQLNNANKTIKTLKDIETEIKETINLNIDATRESKIKNEEMLNELKNKNSQIVNNLKLEIDKYIKKIQDNEYNENNYKEKIEKISQLEIENKVFISDYTKSKEIIENLNKTLIMNQNKINENDFKQNKILQDNQNLNQKLVSLSKEIRDLNKKLSLIKDNENNLKFQIEKQKTGLNNQETVLKSFYENQICNLEKKQNETKKLYEDNKLNEIVKLTTTITDLNILINQLNAKIKELENKLQLKKVEFEKKINETKEDIELLKKKQIEEETKRIQINTSAALNQANQQIKIIKSSYEEEKLSLESKHREEIDRITFQNILKINEIQLGLDSQISNLKIDNIQLKEQIDNLTNMSCEKSQFKKSSLIPLVQHSLNIDFLILNLEKELLIQEKIKEESKNSENEIKTILKDCLNAIIILQEKNNSLNKEVKDLKEIVKSQPSRDKDIQEIHHLKELLFKKEKITHQKDKKEKDIETSMNLERNDSYFRKINVNNNSNGNSNKLTTFNSLNNKTQKMLNGVKQFKLKAINCRSAIK